MFGIAPVDTASVEISKVQYYATDSIIADTSLDALEPFVEKEFDSAKVAKKANDIKEKVLSRRNKEPPKKYPKPEKDGWRKNPELVRAVEEARAFQKARQDLIDIYYKRKTSKPLKKDTL